MPRPLRAQLPGALYHVTSHGCAQTRIFLEDGDRGLFLSVLAGVVRRLSWLCHAYCLMDTHYHLLVETPAPNLAAGIQRLNGVYAQTFNRVYRRKGHLFHGRYHAVLVEKESHLLEVTRYIALNPVRAGICHDPAAWAWSSYRATIGLEKPPSFLAISWVLGQFAPVKPEAEARYREFVLDAVSRDSWRPQAEPVVGTPAFIRRFASPQARGGPRRGQTPGSDPGGVGADESAGATRACPPPRLTFTS